jgi:hypothetical protein
MKYKVGDILISKHRSKRKILGICGEVYLLSEVDNYERSRVSYTQHELDKYGYELYKESTSNDSKNSSTMKYKEGDVLISDEGNKRKILKIFGDQYYLSDLNNLERFGRILTQEELNNFEKYFGLRLCTDSIFTNSIGEIFVDLEEIAYYFNKRTFEIKKTELFFIKPEYYSGGGETSELYKTYNSCKKALEEYKEDLKEKEVVLTMEEVAKLAGVDVKHLKIKK